MTRVFSIVFFILMLSSCQTNTPSIPSSSPTIESSPTHIPTATATIHLTSTVTPTPTLVPTATTSPKVLEESAGALCEKSYSAPVQSKKKIETPYLGMYKTETSSNSKWSVSNDIPHLFALSKESVRSIICRLETKKKVGRYTDGSTAFQLTMNIRIISWPDGTVVASKAFQSGPPPKIKTGFGSGYGFYPTGIRSWILSQFDEIAHPDFLFIDENETGQAVAMSPKGYSIALAVSDTDFGSSNPSKLMLLDFQTMQTLSTWSIPSARVNDLIFSPDGNIIVSAGSDSNVFFWDAQTGAELGAINLSSVPVIIKYSPDGKLIAASSSSYIYLLDPVSMQVKTSYPTISTTFSFSPDGGTIYTDSGSMETETGNTIHEFFDYTKMIPTISSSGEVTFDTDLPDFITQFTLSPNGTYGVSYSFTASSDPTTPYLIYTLSAVDVNSWTQISETQFDGVGFNLLSFSPDGKLFAVGLGYQIQLLDTQTWQATQTFTQHTGRILDGAFSQDGKKFISLSTDGTIRIWTVGN